tara:strand:+ start:3070 stop:3270 length:201 start_codon:yes stop_codon:yes gene_type:complete
MRYKTPPRPPQYDASFASNLQNENEMLELMNEHLSKTIDGLRHDNRELKRMLDKAFDAGFELEDDE